MSAAYNIKQEFINQQMKIKNADLKVITFIADFLAHGVNKEAAIKNKSEMLYHHFRSGYCYYFAHILKTAFSSGTVCWASPFGHFVWLYKGVPYDIGGIYDGESDLFIPESYMGKFINDFKHIDGESVCATKEDIDSIIDSYKQILAERSNLHMSNQLFSFDEEHEILNIANNKICFEESRKIDTLNIYTDSGETYEISYEDTRKIAACLFFMAMPCRFKKSENGILERMQEILNKSDCTANDRMELMSLLEQLKESK